MNSQSYYCCFVVCPLRIWIGPSTLAAEVVLTSTLKVCFSPSWALNAHVCVSRSSTIIILSFSMVGALTSTRSPLSTTFWSLACSCLEDLCWAACLLQLCCPTFHPLSWLWIPVANSEDQGFIYSFLQIKFRKYYQKRYVTAHSLSIQLMSWHAKNNIYDHLSCLILAESQILLSTPTYFSPH